jgi:hypothetical protein
MVPGPWTVDVLARPLTAIGAEAVEASGPGYR